MSTAALWILGRPAEALPGLEIRESAKTAMPEAKPARLQ
jgi:hypothetical protein